MRSLFVFAAIIGLATPSLAQNTQGSPNTPVTPSAGLFNSLHRVISNPDAAPRRHNPPLVVQQPAAPAPTIPPNTTGATAP